MIVDEARKGDWGQDVLNLDYHTEGFSCCCERDPLKVKIGSSVMESHFFNCVSILSPFISVL